jgi:hypothetical protein
MNTKLILFLLFLFVADSALLSTFVIDVPGTYKIPNDLSLTATGTGGSVILINASDVKIDFQNNVVQLSNPTVPTIDGIVINVNLSNIFIHNVSIQNISGSGIHVLDGCSNITIQDCAIQNCYGAGIFFDGLSSGTGIKASTIKTCRISTCTGAAGAPAYGIRLVQCSTSQINNCDAAYNDASTTTSGYGIYLESCSNCVVQKSTAMFNGGTGRVAGVALITSYTCLLDETTAFNNINRDFGNSGNAAGFLLNQSYSNVCYRCKSSGNRNSKTSGFGFLAQTGQENVFQECIAEHNSGGTVAAGLQLDGETKSSVLDCKSKNQATTISGTAYGIFLTNNCDKCFVRGNTLTSNIGISSSFGIKDGRASSTSVVISNYGFNNGTNFSVTYPGTITLPILTGSLSNILTGLPALTAAAIDNISINP